MKQYLIACRSLTYAQRSARLLERAGFSAHVMRMPASLLGDGCGYAVKISEAQLKASVEFLRKKGLSPKKAYLIGPENRFDEASI